MSKKIKLIIAGLVTLYAGNYIFNNINAWLGIGIILFVGWFGVKELRKLK